MKKHIIRPLFFVIVISLFSFACCEDEFCDDPTNRLCPNFDICLVTPPADASFVILDSIRPTWADTAMAFPVDTFTQWSTVYFRALNDNMESYEWKIGTDPHVFTEREFELAFDQFEGHVDVRLITTAKDEQACLRAGVEGYFLSRI